MPPEPARRRAFAVPAWTERAVLVGIAAWLLASALARLLAAVNMAGAQLLPWVPTGPNSWRPAQPLGDLPFRLEAPLAMLTPLVLVAFVAYGLAAWPDRAARRRFLVAMGFVDALILLLVVQALTVTAPRTIVQSYALSQLATVPILAIGIVLAWPSRSGRALALAGAAIMTLFYASVYWLDGGFPAGHWMADPTALAIVSITRAVAWASVPLLYGAGLLLASSPSSSKRSRTAAAVPPAPSTR